MDSVCIDPTDQGLPVRRPRVYTCGDHMNLILRDREYSPAAYRLMFSSIEVSAKCFFDSTDAQLLDFTSTYASARQPLPSAGLHDHMLRNWEPPHIRASVENYIDQNIAGAYGSIPQPLLFFHADQNAHWQGQLGSNMPSLMTKSIPYIVDSDCPHGARMALPIEIAAMQCFPITMSEQHVCSGLFGMEHKVWGPQKMPIRVLKKFIGNAMNFRVVGGVVVYKLLTTSHVPY